MKHLFHSSVQNTVPDYCSVVSHELKTPLSIITGYADLLAEEAISDQKRREYALLIGQESRRLSDLTEKILHLSSLNAGKSILNRTDYCLDKQIRQCVRLLEPEWSAKNLTFQMHLTPSYYVGDRELLSEVWMNLIGNAIKYSLPGGTIRIDLAECTSREIHIYIQDNGIGMDDETADHIFEPFYQGDDSHRQEGHGLGLAITQKILDLHKGFIHVLSEPGKGTLFFVSLPPNKLFP
jgi:signal transduction histidine kinase